MSCSFVVGSTGNNGATFSYLCYLGNMLMCSSNDTQVDHAENFAVCYTCRWNDGFMRVLHVRKGSRSSKVGWHQSWRYIYSSADKRMCEHCRSGESGCCEQRRCCLMFIHCCRVVHEVCTELFRRKMDTTGRVLGRYQEMWHKLRKIVVLRSFPTSYVF